jgi:Dynamin family
VRSNAALQTRSSGDIAVLRSVLSFAARKAPRVQPPTIPKAWLSDVDWIAGELRRARLKLQAVAGVTPPGIIKALAQIEASLARPLRIALVGEFNSGKSSLANLLIRFEGLPTAVVSSTQIPTLLYHSRKPRVFVVHHDGLRKEIRSAGSIAEASITRLEVGLASPRLRGIEILDLPGLADPTFDRGMGDLMLEKTNVLLWCTVSTQAWKESERAAWESLPARLRRSALLVVTHSDLVHDAKDAHKLFGRLRREAAAFSDILPVAAINALALLEGKRDAPDQAAWAATGADALELALDRLLESLAARRIKVALAVTQRVASRALSRL